MSTQPREGTGTRDWTPPVGELRPSNLGGCPTKSWYDVHQSEEERQPQTLGNRIQFKAGHEAELEYLRVLNDERGEGWTVDYNLDNGFGGECHPDALHFGRKVVAEVKFTNFRSPAQYHLAQLRYYMLRMRQITGDIWTGEMHLLDKNGQEPRIFPVEASTPDQNDLLMEKARMMMADKPPPPIMCKSREDGLNVKHYDLHGKPPRTGQNMRCPFVDRCFPTDDDCEV